ESARELLEPMATTPPVMPSACAYWLVLLAAATRTRPEAFNRLSSTNVVDVALLVALACVAVTPLRAPDDPVARASAARFPSTGPRTAPMPTLPPPRCAPLTPPEFVAPTTALATEAPAATVPARAMPFASAEAAWRARLPRLIAPLVKILELSIEFVVAVVMSARATVP